MPLYFFDGTPDIMNRPGEHEVTPAGFRSDAENSLSR